MRKFLAVMISCGLGLAGCSSGGPGNTGQVQTDPNGNLVPIQGSGQAPGYGYDQSQYNFQQQYGSGYSDPLASIPPGRYVVSGDQSATIIGSTSYLSALCAQLRSPNPGDSAYNPAASAPPLVCDWDGQTCNGVAYLTKNMYLNPRMDPDLLCYTPTPYIGR